jgi:hypothetical protein
MAGKLALRFRLGEFEVNILAILAIDVSYLAFLSRIIEKG